MKINTFYWNSKPFDIHLIAAAPENCDFSGYSLFAIDGFQALVCIDLLDAEMVQSAVFNARHHAEPFPRQIMREFFTSFCRDDVVVESESPLDYPLVSFDGLIKLGDLLPECDRPSWDGLLYAVAGFMRRSNLALRQYLESKTVLIEIETEDGERQQRRMIPTMPIRVVARVLKHDLFSSCLDTKPGRTEGITPDYVGQNERDFIEEKAIADALTRLGYSCPSSRQLLVDTGFLSVVATKNGRNCYKITSKGQGYGISGYGKTRLWHYSIIKLLESSLK